MSISFFNVLRNQNIGVFISASDQFLIVPPILTERKVARLASHLGVERIVKTRICGSKLIGVFAVTNSHGAVLPEPTEDEELERLRRGLSLEVRVVPCKATALGNLVLANDRGGVVDHRLPRPSVEMMEDALGVELVQATIAGLPYVGSLGVATNKGALIHPRATEDEVKVLAEALDVPVSKGTVNSGTPYVKVGLVANSHGAVVGRSTTGTELAAIADALKILE